MLITLLLLRLHRLQELRKLNNFHLVMAFLVAFNNRLSYRLSDLRLFALNFVVYIVSAISRLKWTFAKLPKKIAQMSSDIEVLVVAVVLVSVLPSRFHNPTYISFNHSRRVSAIEQTMMSMEGAYKRYRAALDDCTSASIPYMYARSFIHIHSSSSSLCVCFSYFVLRLAACI